MPYTPCLWPRSHPVPPFPARTPRHILPWCSLSLSLSLSHTHTHTGTLQDEKGRNTLWAHRGILLSTLAILKDVREQGVLQAAVADWPLGEREQAAALAALPSERARVVARRLSGQCSGWRVVITGGAAIACPSPRLLHACLAPPCISFLVRNKPRAPPLWVALGVWVLVSLGLA